MKLTVCLISTLVLVMLISPAFAYSSLNGPTGTANLPNAEIAKSGLAVSADFESTASSNVQSWRGVYGLCRSFELSADYVATSRTTKGVAAKYMLNGSETNKNSVGLVWGTTSALQLAFVNELTRGRIIGPPPGPGDGDGSSMMFNRINTVQGYFAHTKTFTLEGYKRPALLGTVGVNYTDMTFRDGVGRVFGSLEARYMGNSVGFDIQSRNRTIESDPMWSVVARREFSSGVGVEFGWTNSMGMLGGRATHLFFGGMFAHRF